jgi:hypothetical protein
MMPLLTELGCNWYDGTKMMSALTGFFSDSIDFFAGGNLAGLQKGFDKFALATNGQARKSFEPFPCRHFGLSVEPVGEQTELISRNIPGFDALQQMSIQRAREVAAPDAGHGYSP